jgi:diacylglycerol kinase
VAKTSANETRRQSAVRMHGILVALPSGIMFGLFWAVKQFHVYCLIFSRKLALGVKLLKNSRKTAILKG